MTKNLALFSFFALFACSSSEFATISVDETAAMSFAKRLQETFPNYADASGYQKPKPPSLQLRAELGEPVILFRGNGSNQDFIIYTFDMRDSCVIYTGYLKDEPYLLKIGNIPVPTGRYLLKLGDRVDTFDRPESSR